MPLQRVEWREQHRGKETTEAETWRVRLKGTQGTQVCPFCFIFIFLIILNMFTIRVSGHVNMKKRLTGL